VVLVSILKIHEQCFHLPHWQISATRTTWPEGFPHHYDERNIPTRI